MPDLKLPITRYYGSKRRLVERIWQELVNLELEFNSVLDIFGGSASFAYFAKLKGKAVIYNDIFRFNYLVGSALVENSQLVLTKEAALSLLNTQADVNYDNVIERNFGGIYYPDDENRQIDVICQNINRIDDFSQQASAFYLLFQACLIKRPYNLFHRKNLNLRTDFNGGGFGNKVTWERSFEELFARFYDELEVLNFDNEQQTIAVNHSALNCPAHAQLLYIDPPYFHKDDHTPYHSRYHFLEGLANYDQIEENINPNSRNKEILINRSAEFENKRTFLDELSQLVANHQQSIIVISYRNNGIPTIEEIRDCVQQHKPNVRVIDLGQHNYALSKSNADNFEFLIVGY